MAMGIVAVPLEITYFDRGYPGLAAQPDGCAPTSVAIPSGEAGDEDVGRLRPVIPSLQGGHNFWYTLAMELRREHIRRTA